MRLLKAVAMVLVLAVPLMGADCGGDDDTNNAEEKQREATNQLQEEAYRQVGMPNLTNFQELKFAKQIMELRDQEITTYTYMVDFNGNLHFVCQSVGYGLPYSTQMTNPDKTVDGPWEGDFTTIPQPEPNGLYMPDNVSATWILCQDPSEGDVDPIYSEPELFVSPFRLKAEGGSYYDEELQAAQETPGLNAGEGN